MKFSYVKIVLIIYLSVASETFAKDTCFFIESKELEQMNTVIKGFSQSFPGAEISVLDLKGERDTEKVKDDIRKNGPSVIIALGSLAANTAISAEKKIPIIFSMVINHNRYQELRQDNVTGVSMEIPAETLLTYFRMLLPQMISVGVPFHPSVSSEIVGEALGVSKKVGIELVPVEVVNPDEIKDRLGDKEKKYSGLWMLADTKLYNSKTNAIYDLFSFSKEKKKPVLAFSEAFLKAGAFFSVSIDYSSLGSQLAMISKRLIKDKTKASEIPVGQPIGTFTAVNRNVAAILPAGMIDESVFDEADKVYSEEESKK
jgi:putative tryptophan/tyrosine transport system substrate-binding protein